MPKRSAFAIARGAEPEHAQDGLDITEFRQLYMSVLGGKACGAGVELNLALFDLVAHCIHMCKYLHAARVMVCTNLLQLLVVRESGGLSASLNLNALSLEIRGFLRGFNELNMKLM